MYLKILVDFNANFVNLKNNILSIYLRKWSVYLQSEEDDSAEAHPGMQGVEVADWLSVAIFVLVLKIAMEL
jgi:hypothetical protein